MKILITGSNGLLGQKLVALLQSEAEIQLIATSRGLNRLSLGNYIYESLDICDSNAVDFIFSKHNPDVVIHTAAMTNVDQCEGNKEACWQLNVTAVDHLVKACNELNTHLLHLSTDFIFDGTVGPLKETAIPNPVNYYGESKLAAEKLVQSQATSWAIARTVLVYGIAHDMSRSNIILWVKNSLESRKPIEVVTDQWRTPTLAEDLAMGCYLIAKKKAEGIFHISGEELLTPYQMAIKSAEFFDLDQSLINKTNAIKFSQPAKRPPKTGFIIEKARKELGYTPKSFEEGLAVVAEQIRS